MTDLFNCYKCGKSWCSRICSSCETPLFKPCRKCGKEAMRISTASLWKEDTVLVEKRECHSCGAVFNEFLFSKVSE